MLTFDRGLGLFKTGNKNRNILFNIPIRSIFLAHFYLLSFSPLIYGVQFAQGSCRTRDNYGEPLATSYHSEFMGTVDYIW